MLPAHCSPVPESPAVCGAVSRAACLRVSQRFSLQAEILQESRMMIPDCQRRLEAAYTDLQQILESEKDLEEAEEYKEARLVLDSVKLEA